MAEPAVEVGYCPNVPLSGGHQVNDITNGHFIHTGPLLKRDQSFNFFFFIIAKKLPGH